MKTLILQECHEIVRFVSLRAQDDQNDYSKLVRIIRASMQFVICKTLMT